MATETTRCSKNSLKQCCRTNLQSILIMVGVLTGIVVGVSIQMSGVRLTSVQLSYVKFPGELFLQMMKMVMIPVVVSSLLTATADIDVRTSGKIGVRALVYYLVTLIIASCLGIVLCLTVQPGKRTESTSKENPTELSPSSGSPLYAFMDLIRNLIPDNLVEACFSSKTASVTTVPAEDGDNVEPVLRGNKTIEESLYAMGNETVANTKTRLEIKTIPGANMVGLVAVSVFTGGVISYAGQLTKPVYDFFVAVRTIAFIMVSIFLWYAPVGVAFLIISTFAGLGNLAETAQSLAVFTVTVIGGLILHVFVVLPGLFFILTRKNPYRFLRNMIEAMLVAFGAESSSIAIPVTIRCLEEKNGLDPRVSRLVASVGATINMDGTCLYYSMMAIFLAQLSGITLDAGQIINISIMSISMAVGTGCVTGAQIAYMIMMPAALNLPADNVSMLFAVDWLLARLRTATNIIGDSFGAGIVDSLSKRELEKEEPICQETETVTEPDERETFLVGNDKLSV